MRRSNYDTIHAMRTTLDIPDTILCGVVINLIPNAASASMLAASAKHALSPVHWMTAVFLAAMMAYNIVRPVAMGHRKPKPY